MPPPNWYKRFRLRVRVLCALAGMWGVATGYAIFVLISQRAQETRGFSAAIHFLGILAVAVIVVAITEWFRDTIRGEQSGSFRSLSAILTSVLLLAVFEVCVLAYEEVSQAGFESPYALTEIAARVSAKEIPYEFFRPADIVDARKLVARLREGLKDAAVGKRSPEGWIAYNLPGETQWTLYPDDVPRPARHDAMVMRVKGGDPLLSDCAKFRNARNLDPYVWASKDPCGDTNQGTAAQVSPLSASDQTNFAALLRKLYVVSGIDDAELGYFGGGFYGIPPGADVQSANESQKPCDPKDTRCEPPTSSDVSVLADITARNLDDGRLCEILVVELNKLISYPYLYDEASFRWVELPEGSKALLKQEQENGSRYNDEQDHVTSLKAQPESEEIDDQIEETKGEIARLDAMLLPLPRLVQLNRRLLVASFPGLLTSASEQFDDRNANMIALGLLWMCAGGALGWILAGGILGKQEIDAHPARRGGLRGLTAALGAAPAFVVAYVLILRLGNLVHDALHFQHELHYLWHSTERPPDDILGSTLVPTVLRLDGYWAHKWTTLGVFALAATLLALFWEFYGRRRRMAFAVRCRWLGLSAALLALLGIVSDANIPFVYLLVGLVWITPAVFLGLCSPYLRTGSAVPPVWGIISVGMGIALLALTILRLWWSVIPFWLFFPGIALVAAGLLMRAGRKIEEYWPLAALALGLIVCGTSAIVQRATFLGVLSDVHELNANGGYGVQLWPDMPKLHSRNPKNTANASQVANPLGGATAPDPSYHAASKNDRASTPSASGAPQGLGGKSSGGLFGDGSADSVTPGNSKAGTQSPATSAWAVPTASSSADASWDDFYEAAGEGLTNFSTQELLTRGFKDRIETLRWQASASTGDYWMDQWIESWQKDDDKRVHGVRDDVARLLELSIVGSLGFWLTVGLLAGWAMQQKAESNDAGGPKAALQSGHGVQAAPNGVGLV